MEYYLFRISTKQASVWSKTKPKPVYFVARSKKDALDWANETLKKDLAVSKITKLALQLAPSVFTSI